MSQRQVMCIGAMDEERRVALASQFLRASLELKGEAALMAMIKCQLLGPRHDVVFFDAIPFDRELDTLAFEFGVPSGRADIMVSHANGSMTVVEVKDGTQGHRHVLAGIGQVGLYALELGMSSGRPRLIRRALFWTSVGAKDMDASIWQVCEGAGVIAMPWASLQVHHEIGRAAVAGQLPVATAGSQA